jgi:hypothetical protein
MTKQEWDKGVVLEHQAGEEDRVRNQLEPVDNAEQNQADHKQQVRVRSRIHYMIMLVLSNNATLVVYNVLIH